MATRRRLDQELVRRRLVPSRQAARLAVESGRVVVEGIVVPKPSSLIAESASVRLEGAGIPFVSRGGIKLDGALSHFAIDVDGASCVDVGASTGGFTDCLLQRGAARVVAVDVGYGQLDWSLRGDDRVVVVERTNVRLLDPAAVGAPFDVVVADLSFISLASVAPHLAALGSAATNFVVLVKPQFEAGRGQVGKGGVVRDETVHGDCIATAAAAMATAGYPADGAVASSLRGPAGNREFFLWCRAEGRGLAASEIELVVSS
jgi:23S rRNA (cytidine1920-2'-O)/16S rRNA (cytidine1409-2'-O)-methyltransferase